VLEEVEQYVSLGFVDDARDALREVAARYAGHPLLVAKVAELGLELEPAEAGAGGGIEDAFAELDLSDASAPAKARPEARTAEPGPISPVGRAAPATAAEDAGGLDLGDELGELFGAQAAVEEEAPAAGSSDLGDTGLADIFKEFKKGVDKQLGKEDYDTRYNLGIAYKEMGLVDEAIAEFQLAAKDESRVLECASMLGICFLEKGMPKLAVKWFEKGLAMPGRREEEYQGLRYDLAMALEAAGDTDKALSLFTDLYGQDANFRDVAAKVRELGGA
jgi:tetratricopeptide (TPR) repeat protein